MKGKSTKIRSTPRVPNSSNFLVPLEFGVHEQGKRLAAWLNQGKESNAVVRVKKLIQVMLEVERLGKEYGTGVYIRSSKSKPRPLYPDKVEGWKKLGILHAAMESKIRNYRFEPRLFWTSIDKRWQLSVDGVAPDDGFTLKSGTTVVTEADAVFLLMSFAVRNRLQALKQCSYCKDWIMVKRRNQHYCRRACRQANYRNNEDIKARRRDYMLNNRKLKKLGFVK